MADGWRSTRPASRSRSPPRSLPAPSSREAEEAIAALRIFQRGHQDLNDEMYLHRITHPGGPPPPTPTGISSDDHSRHFVPYRIRQESQLEAALELTEQFSPAGEETSQLDHPLERPQQALHASRTNDQPESLSSRVRGVFAHTVSRVREASMTPSEAEQALLEAGQELGPVLRRAWLQGTPTQSAEAEGILLNLLMEIVVPRQLSIRS